MQCVRKETLLLPFTVLSSRTGLLGAVFRVSLQLQEPRLEMRTHQNGPLQLHHVASSLPSPEIRTPTRGPPALSHCRAYMGHIHVQVCESKLGKEGGSLMGTFLEEGRHFPWPIRGIVLWTPPLFPDSIPFREGVCPPLAPRGAHSPGRGAWSSQSPGECTAVGP